MNLSSSVGTPSLGRIGLDSKDRKMLLILLALVAVIVVLLAIFTPGQDPNKNPTPDSYLTGQHGAKAAFTLLQQTGYSVVRWEEPLSNLAGRASSNTILILAEPASIDSADRDAIAEVLGKGGRVLSTGLIGGMLLPGNAVASSAQLSFAACEAQPDGISPIAGAGSIWIVPNVTWSEKTPEVHTDYTCANRPVVVDYPVGKGHVVWWASSTPLENGSITRGQNLELLLNSIGPSTPGLRVYWDESLHGKTQPTPWDYTTGPLWTLLWAGALGLTLLLVLSFSRRSGPVRPLPQAPRTTPIEFLDALGGLYRATGAASTALEIAWERFRSQTAQLTGQQLKAKASAQLHARDLAAAIVRRFGSIGDAMESDLIAAEIARDNPKLKPRQALKLIQTLRRHEETLRTASTRGRAATNPTEAGVSPPLYRG